MPKPVILSVNVDLTPALVALRAFEIRVARVTSFGLTGRPSFVVGSAAFLAPSIGSSTVSKGSPISRVQFTSPAPNDQTIRSLAMLGAMDLMSGQRIAGVNEQLSGLRSEAAEYRQKMKAFSARGLNVGAMNAANVRMRTLDARVTAGAAVVGGGVPSVVAPATPLVAATAAAAATAETTRKSPKDPRDKPAKSRPAKSGMTTGMFRSGAEAAGIGRLLVRGTAAGVAVAGIAFLRDVNAQRSRLLREAAESGDPDSFSYTQVLKASYEEARSSLVEISKAASVLSFTVVATAFEAVGQGFIGLSSLLDQLFAGSDMEGVHDRQKQSREYSRSTDAAISAADGSVLKAQAVFRSQQDAWMRGFEETAFRAGVFKEKVVQARALQALSLGFNFGSLGEIEDTIDREIGSNIVNQLTHEYEDANPYVFQKAQTGKKD